MMEPDGRRWIRAAAAATMLVMGLGTMTAADASCNRGHRVPMSQADCLEGGIKQGGKFELDLWARNKCAELGSMVVKWNVSNARDHTWRLSDSSQRTKRVSRKNRVRGPYCCEDLGLCNRRDRSARPGPYEHNNAGCTKQWERSGAAKLCDLTTIQYKRGASRWCRITALCEVPGAQRARANRSVKIQRVDELKWCANRLPKQGLVYWNRC